MMVRYRIKFGIGHSVEFKNRGFFRREVIIRSVAITRNLAGSSNLNRWVPSIATILFYEIMLNIKYILCLIISKLEMLLKARLIVLSSIIRN